MRVDDRRALFAADYMSNYRCFTHDAERFPDPMALSTKLHDQGIKGVWMLDPGIARCEGYDAYDDGTAKNVWVCTADGTSPFVGKVWPGDCVFPDFSSRRVREWWAARVQSFALSFGADGIWVDMNESAPSRYVASPFPGAFRGRSQLGLDPSFGLGRTSGKSRFCRTRSEPALFEAATKTMAEDAVHHADGGDLPHALVHNAYGFFMAQATRAGLEAAVLSGESAATARRPFVLTRASSVGGHRFAATWTGDNRRVMHSCLFRVVCLMVCAAAARLGRT
jgi:alpha-glucosidase